MLHIDHHTKSTIHRTIEKLRQSYMTPIGDLSLTGWITKEPVPFEDRLQGEKKELKPGDSWGQLWDCGWFHITGQVPQEGAGKKIVLLIDINGEGNIYDEHLCPIRGITNVSSTFERSLGEPTKKVYHFLDKSQGNEAIDLWMETGCNDLFGSYCKEGTIEQAQIAVCHDDMRQLYYDFEVLRNLVDVLEKSSARYHEVFRSLKRAAYALNPLNDETVKQARQILKESLDKQGGDPSLSISAIGHAHIDLAWLWPIRETKRKGARTFSTVMGLMDRYPDYVFGASQPQLFQWMKEDYPQLYDKMKSRIEEGRFEVQGGMWVESDTNVPSGESLVRQLLYGKAYFREEFNKDIKVLWLPDVFGYSGALPQILKKSGIDYFMTIKLSWSEVNKFPHHTFNWEGIDGTSVLAHMPPEGTYNSSATPKAVKDAEHNFRDKGVSDECLMLYGIGDGGGGPGAEHLERLQRMKNLSGIAPVKQEPAIDFFERLKKYQQDYATWKGELYLEKHQGTYTTSAKSKWFNRKMELALGQLEYLFTLVQQDAVSYNQHTIETLWKEVLLYQFHDILPGSSIKRVYDESIARYALCYKQVMDMIDDTLDVLQKDIQTEDLAEPYLMMNPTSYTRSEWVTIGEHHHHVTVPPYGYKVIDNQKVLNQPACAMKGDSSFIENDCVKIEFNEAGGISRIYDKQHHQEVIDGTGNQLTLYHDHGDAWDISMDYPAYVEQVLQPDHTTVEVGATYVKATQTYSFGESKMTQDIVLHVGSSRIDFITDISWHESNKMLRVAFPTTIQTNQATCDIQFGHIKRSNDNNTTWEGAQFEICAQKWVDLSHATYGVALMNDSKYGYAVNGSTLDLDLIRSTNYPGKDMDKGQHQFTYALYPHAGDTFQGGVNQEAYALNVPLVIKPCDPSQGTLAMEQSFIQSDNPQIVIETIKRAENGDGIIVRMYESAGGLATGNITCHIPHSQVQEVNLMEESMDKACIIEEGKIKLTFQPFEIKTLHLY